MITSNRVKIHWIRVSFGVFLQRDYCFQAAWLPPHNVPSEQNGPFSFSFPSLRVLDSIYFNYIFNHKNEEMMRLTLNLKLG